MNEEEYENDRLRDTLNAEETVVPEPTPGFDQGCAFISENMPPMWRRMYEKLLYEGFDEEESLKLVQTYILSQCPDGINGAEG